MNINSIKTIGAGIAIAAALTLASSHDARAHCDTMDGPVIADARAAIETGDVQPVLKWVSPTHEQEIRRAFESALTVRTASPAARQLADQYFFETLVRIHRDGEGAPYTGLKPAGAVDPAIALADAALESESPDALVQTLTGAVQQAIREKFAEVVVSRKDKNKSTDDGRRYVAAYVAYVHFIEQLHQHLTNEHIHGTTGE